MEDKMYKLTKGENNLYTALVSITGAEWDGYLNKAYEDNKAKYDVQGFRKGKAPRKVIEQNYGPTIFYDDALDKLFVEAYTKILDENQDLRPIDHPKLEIKKFDEKAVELEIIVQSLPDVKLGQYKGIEVEGSKVEVSEDQVEAEINQQREKLARFNVSEKKAENGDFVTIDFVGSIDGVEFEGGTAEDYRLELGSGAFIPGFEEQIVGMNIGEKKVINVKFPEDYHADNLKGKDSQFAVTLNKVEVKELPALDDEFASNISKFETLAEYREDVRKHLLESAERRAEHENQVKILDKIVEGTEVNIPDAMVNTQLEVTIQNLRTNLSYQGLSLEDYFEYTNTTMDDLRKERFEQAKDEVKTFMVFDEIVKREKIEVTDEEFDNQLTEIAKKYKKSLEDYKKSVGEKGLNRLKDDILKKKFIDFIVSQNKIL